MEEEIQKHCLHKFKNDKNGVISTQILALFLMSNTVLKNQETSHYLGSFVKT